jgi:hypothetical protein
VSEKQSSLEHEDSDESRWERNSKILICQKCQMPSDTSELVFLQLKT